MGKVSVFQDALKIDIQSRFTDFDMVKHLNNSAYLSYIEIARSDGFTQAVGVDTKKHTGVAANVAICFKKPIRFGTSVSILMRVEGVKKSSKRLHFEFVDSNDLSRVFATAEMTQIYFDMESHEPIPVPEFVRNYIKRLESNKENDQVLDCAGFAETLC